jgi:hypothetical protein
VVQTLIEHYSVPSIIPTGAVSRKTHASAGAFDIPLPLTGTPGIECRTGGANGDFTIVVTFANPVQVSGDSVASSDHQATADPPQVSNNIVTVNLHHVSNAQAITLTLTGVSDGTHTGDVTVPMDVLIGDTTGDRTVDSADVSQTKSRSGQRVSAANFRSDVTADGNINSADISLVKSKSGTALP